MADDLRRYGLRHSHQVVERNHGAGVGAHIELTHVLGLSAKLFVSLNIYAIGTVIEVEIIDIGGAHVDAQCVRDLTEGNVQALGFFAVNGDQELGIVGSITAENASQILACIALPGEVLGDFG